MSNRSEQKGSSVPLYAWLPLAILAALLTLSGSYILFGGIDEAEFLADTGGEWAAFLRDEPGPANYLLRIFGLLGTAHIGAMAFATAICLTAFRQGQRWAWFVMLLFPLVLAGYARTFYAFGASELGLYYSIATGLAALPLAISYRKFS